MIDLDEPRAWANFQPRPDQPERFDQQESFYWSELPGVAFMVGGNGGGTSEVACAKAAKFMLADQEPPRPDTPFWCIAESYEQVCNALWKEKLFGHGHIPAFEIDWERIRWYRPMQGWPYEVPLLPWKGRPGKNWSIKFKSYKQGRAQMQAESIGGFLFSEQFPWELLIEVTRGCREYAFRGGKMAEFTPVDPELSVALEDHLELGTLPEGWDVFRANTECALEAGHVTPEWYREFFGLVPDEMRLVRQIGAFASFEGAIYPSFNPAIHFTKPGWEIPPFLHHRRAIDWGFGPDNAFVCLWGCRDNVGRWFVYDEYWSTDQTRTIHDHLKIIHDRWPWPQARNMYYGCTYADPSDPGNMRIASLFSNYQKGYENFDIQGASNAVYAGIEHVRWLLKFEPSLKSPRLIIDKEACPNLSREMRTYRWEKGNDRGLNPRDARPVPLKKDDHCVDCLRYLTFSEANKAGIVPETKRRERETKKYGVQLDRKKR